MQMSCIPRALAASCRLLTPRRTCSADVKYAQEDLPIYPTLVPNDPEWKKQWAMQRIGAEAAWEMSVGGTAAGFGAPPPPPPVPDGTALNGTRARGSSYEGPVGMYLNVTVCITDSGGCGAA